MIQASILAALMLTISCGGDSDPFERVTKLRALGVSASPLVSEPSTSSTPSVATLIFHLLVPTGQTITADPYKDDESLFAIPIEVSADKSSVNYEDYSSLRHYTISASVTIPTADKLAFNDENGAARLRYSVLFTSGHEKEKVVGTIFVMPSGKAETFDPLDIQITNPVTTDILRRGAERDITANVNNSNDEPLKVGWFVSDGRIDNRRAAKAKWKIGDSPRQLLVATVRGKRSRSFAIQFLELETE